MATISEILDFFRKNNCDVTVEIGRNITFDIWSNVLNRYIIRDANDVQLRNFYENVFKP